MKRKIYEKMLEWKRSSNGATALMLDGARRVGKSYIAEEFARNEYERYLLIDFTKVSSKVKRYFNDYLEDLDLFFMYLFGAYNVSMLPKGRSLIIFDEVQRFPKAREAIKHLVADGRYHYIETGSLISINRNVKDIVIPSEERHLKMYPMDFEEFLMATGNDGALAIMKMHFASRKPFGRETHETYMDLFRQYMVVGGMPQAVQKYIDTHDLAEVDAIKRDILSLYRGDIHKFAGALRHKALSIYNAIPSELTRHERKFVLADLKKDARMRDYDSSFEWLKSAMTVDIAYASTEPSVGMGMRTDVVSLKCYSSDSGLLISQTFDPVALKAENVHERLLTDKLSVDKGMIVENTIAQMILAAGHELYFYSNSDREEADNRMEIDFLVCKPDLTRRHNIIPIEVKSNKDYTTVSLDRFRRKFTDALHTPVVLHPKDLKQDKGIVYLPMYMAQFIVTEKL